MMYNTNFAKAIKEVSEQFEDISKKVNGNNYEYKGNYFTIGFTDYISYIKVKVIDIHEQLVLNFNIQKTSIQNTKSYFYDVVMEQIKIKISYYYNMQLALEDIEHTIWFMIE